MTDTANDLLIAPPASADSSPPAEGQPPRKPKRQQFKRDKRDVHGWVVLDKPVGMTSRYRPPPAASL